MLNPVLIPVKVMRTPHPNAEDDPWTFAFLHPDKPVIVDLAGV
ncbi:hypothetical protein [Methanospirillum purgamenti]|nr:MULTISPECIES: hypothetical protein [Methanospirillum]MDX8551905.1 hypothetical protein [Methanospirillum hungatei]